MESTSAAWHHLQFSGVYSVQYGDQRSQVLRRLPCTSTQVELDCFAPQSTCWPNIEYWFMRGSIQNKPNLKNKEEEKGGAVLCCGPQCAAGHTPWETSVKVGVPFPAQLWPHLSFFLENPNNSFLWLPPYTFSLLQFGGMSRCIQTVHAAITSTRG